MKKIFVLIAIVIALTSCKSVGKSLVSGIGEGVVSETGKIIGQVIVDSLGRERVSSQRYLLHVASEINKELPIMVGRETLLSNVTAQNNALIYSYVLVNYSSREVDSHAFISSISQVLTNSVCSNPDTQALLNNGVSLHYSYNANDHIFIGKVIVSPSDCRY